MKKNTATKMTAAEVMTAAAAVLKKYGSISAIKAAAPALRAKYGQENWAAILGDAKAARAKDIDAAGDAARAVFTYRGIMGAVFAEVAKTKGYTALCKYARRKYTGRDADTAAAVVRDYYAAVSEDGAPVCRSRFLAKSGGLIFEAYTEKALTKSAAVPVLESALKGLQAAAKNAARKGVDADTAARDNVRAVGRIVAVYAALQDTETGLYAPGARLDTAPKGAKADAAAARLIGRPVPTDARPVGEVNADIKAARAKAAAAPKATAAAKHAAKAPKGTPKAPKAPKASNPAQDTKAAAVAAVAAA